MERVWAPVEGYHIVTHAAIAGEAEPQFASQARVYRHRPRGYWDGVPAAEFVLAQRSRTADEAHAAAYRRAVRGVEARHLARHDSADESPSSFF